MHCRPPRVTDPRAVAKRFLSGGRGTRSLSRAVLILSHRTLPFRSRQACRHACRGRISTASDSERVAPQRATPIVTCPSYLPRRGFDQRAACGKAQASGRPVYEQAGEASCTIVRRPLAAARGSEIATREVAAFCDEPMDGSVRTLARNSQAIAGDSDQFRLRVVAVRSNDLKCIAAKSCGDCGPCFDPRAQGAPS